MKKFLNKNIIFWDFDGVILDSLAVREKGFQYVLKDFPQKQVEILLDFHRENGGLSRYVKFRYFFEEIRGEKVSDFRVNRLSQNFSGIMKKELVHRKFLIRDTFNFIQENFLNYDMHITSGSDENELKFICEKLGISFLFKSINGSPIPKKDIVGKILKDYQYSLPLCILIGDSINDYDAAVANKIDFFGYNNERLKLISQNYIEKFY